MPAPQALPPIATEPLSVVLLAHNASAHVEEVLADWLAFLDARGGEGELVLVDDASTDDTASRAAAVATTQPRLRVLGGGSARGAGATLRRGIEAATRPLF